MNTERINVRVMRHRFPKFLTWIESRGFEKQPAPHGIDFGSEIQEYLYMGFQFIYVLEGNWAQGEIPRAWSTQFEEKNFGQLDA